MIDIEAAGRENRLQSCACHMLIEGSEILKKMDEIPISQTSRDEFFQILRFLAYDRWEG